MVASKTTKKQSKFSLFAIVWGALFGGAGLFFVFLVGSHFLKTLDTYTWTRTPAVIEKLWVDYPKQAPSDREDNVFELKSNYRYTFGGKEYQGESVSMSGEHSSSYGKLAGQVDRMISGEVAHVYVDPNAPGNAILRRDSLLFGLVVLFPMVFVIIGLSVLADGLGLAKESDEDEDKNEKIRKSRNAKISKPEQWGTILFGLVFLLCGLAALNWTLIKPWRRSVAAKSWESVPCKVLWSRVRIVDGDESDTYAPDVFFEYKIDAEIHRSNRYNFMGGSSSGRKSKSRIVAKYPTGKETECFVNPDQPYQAVMSRDLGQIGWWWLLTLPFIGVGLAVMTFGSKLQERNASWFDKRKKKKIPDGKGEARNAVQSQFAAKSGATVNPGTETRLLKSRSQRWGSFVGVCFFAAFWNGMVSMFLFGFTTEAPMALSIFGLIFMLPFIGIGLVLIGGVAYAFASLWNPAVELKLTPGEPVTGGPLSLEWNIEGNVKRVQQLKVFLEGSEEAGYRRGTDYVRTNSVFYRKAIVLETDHQFVRSGIVEFELPHGLMPTLELTDNKIKWQLIAHGQVKLWADIWDKFSIELLPFTDDH